MDKVQLNLSFHNLSSMIENLRIFDKNRGRYSIISPLKLNEKRAIYLVKDEVLSNSAEEPIYKVLKFLLQVNMTDEQKRIYRFYESVDHPNFCKIESIEEIDRFVMIVQEHIDGPTLQGYFQTDLSKAQKYRTLFDLIFALDYIHNFSLVHGDIKPDNIIVRTSDRERYGTPVIIDYDLGKDMTTSDFRATSKPFGTNLYMSPEMINDQVYDFKTDIWSLGMTLYSCIIPTRIIQCDLHHVLSYATSESQSPMKTLPKSTSFTSERESLIKPRSPSRNLIDSDNTAKNIGSPRGRRFSDTRKKNRQSINLDEIPEARSPTYSSPQLNQSFRVHSFSTKTINSLYDFDHMVHKLDQHRHLIQDEYGSLFFNTIRAMLLKDHRRRPSAHRLKNLILHSKYYSKLYSKLYPQHLDESASTLLSPKEYTDSDSDSYSAEMFADPNDLTLQSALDNDTGINDTLDDSNIPVILCDAAKSSTDDINNGIHESASNPTIVRSNNTLGVDNYRISRSMTEIVDKDAPDQNYNPDLDNSEEIIRDINNAINSSDKLRARKSKSRSSKNSMKSINSNRITKRSSERKGRRSSDRKGRHSSGRKVRSKSKTKIEHSRKRSDSSS